MRFASRTASSTTTACCMLSAALLCSLSLLSRFTADAQSGPGAHTPPHPSDRVHLAYWNNANEELAEEAAVYNTCFVTNSASTLQYAYLTMVPKNATVNFYKDPECGGAFAFAMDGYYLGYPGEARSFRWVGWSEDAVGELQTKEPIPLMAGSNTAPLPPPPQEQPPSPPPQENEPSPPPATGGQEPETKPPSHGHTGGGNDTVETSYSATFFGGVIGTLMVLSLGGVVFWKNVGKKMMEDGNDKGKSVLPYNRIVGQDEDGDRDEDILLTTSNRSHHQDQEQDSFALGDEDDEDEGQGKDEGDSIEEGEHEGMLSPSGSRHLDH
ncbi:hypothetical protein BGZ83_005279 [Gryganskiella cystojenkinii]|nr:hypothetical protein BGZ83_005279 [Gryganskiella cystojenkinii]